MKSLFCIFLILQLSCLGQNTIGMSVSYSKIDFFHGVEYGRSFNALNVFTGFEYGINRSVFQSRFFPKVKVGTSYAVINKERFKLSPVIQYSYSYLRYSKVPNGVANYHELNGGLRWRYGRKWQIGQTLLVGGLWEQGMNTVYQRSMTSGTLDYVLQIDCVYAF